MADGFTDLEEFVMGVLVRDRKNAQQTIADAHEIVGVVVDRCARLIESWHIRKVGYTELAHSIGALARNVEERPADPA